MKEKIKKFQIRFNVNSTNDNNRWRLITDGKEMLVSDMTLSKVDDTKVQYQNFP